MVSLNHTNVIIFDLWDNRGGYSSMVSLIAAYLFDHPEYIYDPRVSPTPHSSTLSRLQEIDGRNWLWFPCAALSLIALRFAIRPGRIRAR
jgi:hypothetical protein